MFADLVDVKLDKGRFSAQIDKDEAPVARGSFGKVFRNTLSTDVRVCAYACVCAMCVGGREGVCVCVLWYGCGYCMLTQSTHTLTDGGRS